MKQIDQPCCLIAESGEWAPWARKNSGGGQCADEVCLARSRADDMSDATQMLAAIKEGDSKAAEELLVLVYGELRRLAASKLAHEAPGQTLQPTALVHEAWLRLVGDRAPSFNDREHFFRACAEAMRRILIDRARKKAHATPWRSLPTRGSRRH